MSQTAPSFKHQKAWENDKNTFGKENVKITATLKGACMVKFSPLKEQG